MKKLIIPMVLGGAVLFSGGLNAKADTQLQNIVSKTSVNQIELSLEGLKGDSFKIFRDGKLIWEGSDKQFIDKNLEVDYIYNYKIGIYQDNNLVDIITYKTKTDDNNTKGISKFMASENKGSVYAQKTNLEATTGTKFVKLKWDSIPDDDGIYQVYRDGKLINNVKSNTFIDESVEKGKTYNYEVVAKKEVSDEEKRKIDEKLKEQKVDLSSVNKEEIYNEEKSVGKIVEILDEISENELKSLSIPKALQAPKQPMKSSNKEVARALPDLGSGYQAYMFRYTTFIPYASVDNPNTAHETVLGEYGTRLKGDGRGYDPYSPKYRTQVDAYTDFRSGSKFSAQRRVGESVLYSANGNVRLRDTASNSGIQANSNIVNSSRIVWNVSHDVAVPFHFTYPNITYAYEGTAYKNGSFRLSGSHDKAPNHEIYGVNAYTDLPPVTIYRFGVSSEDDFKYLIPGYPQKFFDVSA